MRILVTGAAGFIGGYLVEELVHAGHEVVGLDNFSKYGEVARELEGVGRYRLVRGDAKDVALVSSLLEGCEHFVAGAAMIGGISYFHKHAYDLLAENERITAAAFDAAIAAYRRGELKKITVLSSSMVYERASHFPTPETDARDIPPPLSTYGFQKLAVEYYCQGAHEQYGLPFTIARPFNCIGLGERRARTAGDVRSGNLTLAMSHVLPDLIHKALRGQDPLHVLGDGEQVRHYTYGADLAQGIRLCVEHPASWNEAFNLSSSTALTVRQLAEKVWRAVHGDARPLHLTHDAPYEYDVAYRSPDVEKAKRLLGFQALTTVEQVLEELVPWIREQMERGGI